MLLSHALRRLCVVAVALLVAWYMAGREGLLLGIAVAIVALPAALYRPRLGIAATVAMTAAAVYAPALAAVAVVVAILIWTIAGFVHAAFDGAPYKSRHVGVERTLAGSSYVDVGGGFDGGGGGS